MRFFLTIFFMFFSFCLKAQKDLNVIFQNEETVPIELISKQKKITLTHIDLTLNPSFETETLNGKAILKIVAHEFNRIQNVILNAKYMDIKSIWRSDLNEKDKVDLKYNYDSLLLNIKLDKEFGNQDTFLLHIVYVANPKRIKSMSSKAITDSKGLYFINPQRKNKNLPTQIWTQGEPENNSVWFPTLEDVSQRITQTLRITVPKEYQTLSNGLLVSQQYLNNLRTDVWHQSLPHSTYLVFLGVGQWYEEKDSFKQIPLSYYVDSTYARNAKSIFGNTPKMMSMFEKLFGMPYVWEKYSQVVIHNFVSGAMENTTMVTHETSALQDEKDLYDENIWENAIAHELSHHWFGNLVAAKNWSNLTLQESFANYSESLWQEFNYGKNFGMYNRLKDMTTYFVSNSLNKKLVRESYQNPEDMFDEVSYHKGGAILHMLRSYLGDSVFFKSLKNYLKNNAFKTAEVDNLRMAFEEVSGEDLKWFFNQWYFSEGNPFVNIHYITDSVNKKINIIVKQTLSLGQKLFQFPLEVIKYENNKTYNYQFKIGSSISNIDTLSINYSIYPDLVSVDPDRNILMVKQEEKTTQQYIFQLKNSSSLAEKSEAIFALSKEQSISKPALQAILKATNDNIHFIRMTALENLNISNDSIKNIIKSVLINNLKIEKKSVVYAKILELLASYKDRDVYLLAQKLYQTSPSAKIISASLQVIYNYDSSKSLKIFTEILKTQKNKSIISKAFKAFLLCNISQKDISINDYFSNLNLNSKFDCLIPYLNFILKNEKNSVIENGLRNIMVMKKQIPSIYENAGLFIINTVQEAISKSKYKNKLNTFFETIQKD